MIKIQHGIRANLRRRHYAGAESRASYFLCLSPQSISKRRLGQLSIEGCIFLSKQNLIPVIFNHCSEKFGIFTEEEFFSDPSIGFLSSSKSKFRDLGRYLLLGITPGKSIPGLTPGRKNPKILKMISFGTFTIYRY